MEPINGMSTTKMETRIFFHLGNESHQSELVIFDPNCVYLLLIGCIVVYRINNIISIVYFMPMKERTSKNASRIDAVS